MQCPICATELESEAIVCNHCGAIRVSRRTTVGVFVGWAGMVIALIWVMMWIPLLFMPFIGFDMSEYPWVALIVGTLVAAGLLWYSKSTVHDQWIQRED